MALVGLGVTGGIGAYKAVELARVLQKRGHRVRAVMTRAARRFVGPLTFEAITQAPVITSQFASGLNADIEHIALASDIDVLVVAPATANCLGKFANGIADDFLSALYLATRAPVVVAPAMNTNMWQHAAVQQNLATLTNRGVRIVEPGDGYLACGWIGPGRLAEPEAIADAVERAIRPANTLAGRRIVVTAGPTLEDLDAVRFIGNRSSGRMGFAIAAEARARGAHVVLVAGPTSVAPPAVDELVRVRSAAEMHAAVTSRAQHSDVVVMAAAVADYRLAGGALDGKVEKGGPMTLTLERTADILADLGRTRGESLRPVLVGFAAQVGDPVASARRKLVAKRVDFIVANDVSAPGAGFDVETNDVTIVSATETEHMSMRSKAEVAKVILDRVTAALAAGETASAS